SPNGPKPVPLVIRLAPPTQQRPSQPQAASKYLEADLPSRLRRPTRSLALPIRTAAPPSRKTVVAVRTRRQRAASPQEESTQQEQKPPSKRKTYLPILTTPPELDPTSIDGYNNPSFWHDT